MNTTRPRRRVKEVVQVRLKAVKEELDEIKALNLVDEDGLRQVLKARKVFEIKIHNGNRQIKDYENYVDHEINLVHAISIARNTQNVTEGKDKIELSILLRIKNIYELGIQKFPDNYSLHESFLKFCMNASFKEEGAQLALILINDFPDKLEGWLLFTKWHLKFTDQIQVALEHIERGLMLHPKSDDLYIQAVELELKNCSKEASLKQQEQCNKKIQNYFSSISQHFLDVKVYIKIFEVLDAYPFASSSQTALTDYLFKHHCYNLALWNYFATHALHHSKTSATDDTTTSNVDPVLSCIAKFKMGLRIVPETKKKALCAIYLKELETLADQECQVGKVHARKFLADEIKKAEQENYLPPNYYSVYYDVTGDPKLLNKAVELNPNSALMRTLHLKQAMMKNNEKQVDQAFCDALKALHPSDTLPLWLMMINYHILCQRRNKIAKLCNLYEEGLKYSDEVANVFKPKYVDWMGTKMGIVQARKKYLELADKRPFCKKLHLIMCRMESYKLTPDIKHWETAARFACEQFGHSDIDVWTNYLEFLISTKERTDNFKDQLTDFCLEAKKRLPQSLHEAFTEKYTTRTSKLENI